jgi:polysaccharide biosynthesis/export protein
MTLARFRFAARLIVLAGLILQISQAAAQTAANYVIGPQDVLAIKIFDQPDLDGKYSVESDGTFTFPMIGRIKASGMTIREFENEMKKRLADGYFKDPQVSVAVDQYRSQQIFIMGEVRSPGPQTLVGGMTLIEALARAGSTTPAASGELVIVRSRGEGSTKAPVVPPAGDGKDVKDPEGIIRLDLNQLQTGRMSETYALQDGDTIFVPRAESVYVFGEVRNPGAYPIQSNTTVLQALSLAGGVTPNGATNRIKIVRIEKGQRKEIKNVKLTDTIRPGDTIVVPERFF